MDQPLNQALSYSEFLEIPDSSSSMGAEVQSLVYQSIPLSQLPSSQAIDFIKLLYSPEERFAKGFYRYWKDVLKLPEEEAWQNTLEELQSCVDRLVENLQDPCIQTIGFNQQDVYTPVGLYGFRSLREHYAGEKLYQSMCETGVIQRYPGNLAIAHSFSALNGYRNRFMMKYAFLLIALEALEKGFKDIFFFMSDHRLGPIYKRLGLEFPEDLTFTDSKHLVGCYRITPEHLQDIKATADQFGVTLPPSIAPMFG